MVEIHERCGDRCDCPICRPSGRLLSWIERLFKHTTDYSNVVFSLFETFLTLFYKSRYVRKLRRFGWIGRQQFHGGESAR